MIKKVLIMKNYKLINNITGWFVFAVAAFTYLSTIEPTASFWDCGEFITTGYKMEVGHPPGAPFFMILARFFNIFSFGNVANVAVTVNVLSALASAFTILFLFWSITHIARRVIVKNGNVSKGQLIAITGSGLIGALVYTFSDSFWFSAVEGEVYATSSFFTAVVFWAILKWENEADKKYANRWLILIAYLMGLSIGVHLLNLLAIPAIVFIYYFKKYEVSKKGIIYAALVSVSLLLIIMYGIVQGLFVIGSKFELLFTNTFGLPFFTGLLFYFILLFAGIIYGIYYTLKKNRVLWNTVFTMFAVILIGYSTFVIILIRSKAETPMNQNHPDDVFALLSYLNREQYGDRPLFYGQYFNAPLDENNPYPKVKPVYYDKKDKNGKDKYVIVDYTRKRNYVPEYKTFFPRMYSDSESPDHIHGYMSWTGTTEDEFYFAKINPETDEVIRNRYGEIQYDKYRPKRPPTFAENLKFFFNYQLNFMYFRYFMWNFTGKQNDIQGHGNVKDGNWISGIKFIDEWRLGDQDKIPQIMKDNKARNTYFFLPLLLGIFGMLFLYKQGELGKQYFWVIMLFFFFTGIAIVLYLNQPPFQPRERDYAYAGSFYVFSMYVGFGAAFLYKSFKKYTKEITAAILGVILSLPAPIIMAQQNWDDHDRSYRYTTRDYAENYLSSCDKNAIIFTNGDNDTFPLWYVQEVEGFRTDVRVINLSYFNTDWYINQMRRRAYDSSPVKFTLRPEQYEQGKRDVIYKIENPNIYLQERYEANKDIFETEYKDKFKEYYDYLAKTDFKDKFPKEFAALSKGYKTIDPIQFYSFIKKLDNEQFLKDKKLDIDPAEIRRMNSEFVKLVEKITKAGIPLQTIINHIAQDDKVYKAPLQNGEMVNYLPTTKFVLPVNKKTVLDNGTVALKDSSEITDAIKWDIRKQHITKNEMMVLDMLATNKWQRPIYFATTVGNSLYLKLEDYFQLEGLAYKVVPIKNQNRSFGAEGRVNTDILYNNLMNKFKWGGLDKNPGKIYLDENNRRFIMNFKSSFKTLAEAFIKEKKYKKAEEVLDKCTNLFPNNVSPYNYYDVLLADLYYKINKPDKGTEILKTAANNYQEELVYYCSLEDKYLEGMQDDVGRLGALYQEVLSKLYANKQDETANKFALPAYSAINERFGFNSALMTMDRNAQERWYANLPDYQMALLQFNMFLGQHINE